MDYNLEQVKQDTRKAKRLLIKDYDSFKKLENVDNGHFAYVKKHKSVVIRGQSKDFPKEMVSELFSLSKSELSQSFENKMKKSEIAIANGVDFAPTIDYDIRMKFSKPHGLYEFMPYIDGTSFGADYNLDNISKLDQDAVTKYFRDWEELMRIGMVVDPICIENFIVGSNSNRVNFVDLDNVEPSRSPFMRFEHPSNSLLKATQCIIEKPIHMRKLFERKRENYEIPDKYAEIKNTVWNALNNKQFKEHNKMSLEYMDDLIF